jgi:hypothetical protein
MLAECGKMLLCLDIVADGRGNEASLSGLIPGMAVMQPRLAALGLQQAVLPGGLLRGTPPLLGDDHPSRPSLAGRESRQPAWRGDLPHRQADRDVHALLLPFCSQAVAGIFGRS